MPATRCSPPMPHPDHEPRTPRHRLHPAGFGDGYAALAFGAVTVEVAFVPIPVASLSDVVESKRPAGRAKHIVALPALEGKLNEQ